MPRFKIESIRSFFYQRIFINSIFEKWVFDLFHKRFYYQSHAGGTWAETYWLGKQTLKCPFDLWVYQEIIFEKQPDLIIECGTYHGGSALFLASVCDMVSNGKILSIDISESNGRPDHPRIGYITGRTTSPAVLRALEPHILKASEVMVILDADHRKDHVLTELSIYSDFVSKGNYLVVEDTNLNGNPVAAEFGPGPMEAVQEFLARDSRYISDKSREKYFLTFNPNGYLKRIQ